MRTKTSKGYNKIQVEDGNFALWLNSEGASEGTGIKITTTDGTLKANGKEVRFDINQSKVLGMNPATGNTLTIALREVDYCDTNGNNYKILVLCSEPYSPT